MKILSRFDEVGMAEKCPRCLMLRENFLDIGGELLGCLKCGSVFVRKGFRDGLDVKGMLEAQGRADWVCECGKVCGSKAGLMAHGRVCRDV